NASQMHSEAVRIPRRRVLGELFQDRLQLGVRPGSGHAEADFERHSKIDVGVRRDLQRQVDIRLAPAEARRHHARDPIRLPNQLDGTPNNVGIAAVISLPEPVTEHDHRFWLLPGRSVRRNQPPALQRGRSPVIRSVWTYVRRLDIFGKVAVGGGEVPTIYANDAFDGLDLTKLFDLRP